MKWKEGPKFENPPGGSHIARCYAVIDMGTQVHQGFQGQAPRSQRDVRLVFELAHLKMTGKYNPESKGKPFSQSTTVKQSLHPKASLRKLLTGWRGRDFKDGEAEKFDPAKLPGLLCRLALVEGKDDYVNIDSISPLSKKEQADLKGYKWTNPLVFFSLEEEEFKPDVYKALGKRAQEKIMGSPEYQALVGEHTQGEPAEETVEEPPTPDGDVPF